jgi:hypothetical protein
MKDDDVDMDLYAQTLWDDGRDFGLRLGIFLGIVAAVIVGAAVLVAAGAL